ncbi:MAG TPA: hypothetical protein IAC00_03435 [Candidatus Limivicinus faecipullorum]|nr:hypothetical protein [Candidatus Limivicinus faecipullorum]
MSKRIFALLLALALLLSLCACGKEGAGAWTRVCPSPKPPLKPGEKHISVMH